VVLCCGVSDDLMMPNPVLVVSVDRCVSVICRATPHRCCWFGRSGRVAMGAALCCVVVGVSVLYMLRDQKTDERKRPTGKHTDRTQLLETKPAGTSGQTYSTTCDSFAIHAKRNPSFHGTLLHETVMSKRKQFSSGERRASS